MITLLALSGHIKIFGIFVGVTSSKLDREHGKQLRISLKISGKSKFQGRYHYTIKRKTLRVPGWLGRLGVQLDSSSGHDLGVLGLSPELGSPLSRESIHLPLLLTRPSHCAHAHAQTLFQIHKPKKKKKNPLLKFLLVPGVLVNGKWPQGTGS